MQNQLQSMVTGWNSHTLLSPGHILSPHHDLSIQWLLGLGDEDKDQGVEEEEEE